VPIVMTKCRSRWSDLTDRDIVLGKLPRDSIPTRPGRRGHESTNLVVCRPTMT
jgi:hypothetical protein